MELIDAGIRTSKRGTGITGTGPNSNYGLAECYGDLSVEDCIQCYAEARTVLPNCFPYNGGHVFLDGCFMRSQNYYFFEEYAGSNDTVICGNTTRYGVSLDSARQAISNAARDAPRNRDYFARKVALSGTANESTYVLADCWGTLNESSCAKCLERASAWILKCLPWSEGRALHTGCFMRYSNTNFLNDKPTRGNHGGKRIAIVIAVTSIVAFIIASIIAFYAWKRRYRSKRIQGSDETKLLTMVNNSSLIFKYSTIEKATGSFAEAHKLGQGGFGIVYKGVLPDGREIAAKRLFFNHWNRAGDFYHEINIISSVDHKNLVKLVGFSCLGPESILIYEYLPNKSLNHFIFDAVRGKELNWAKRFDIIVGIAEGLAYLHENSKSRIIHRDIKAANILLDSRLRAKIADFGLARTFQDDKNHISTEIAGTLGYMAPEYIRKGKLTEKVDVFSFGVLLLEVVTGIPNRGMQTSEDDYSLLWIAWRHFKQCTLEEIFDPNLMLNDDTSNSMKNQIKSVIHIGFLCTQEVPSLRPTMSMTLQMLSKKIEPLPSPSNPPCVSESDTETNEFGQIPGLGHRVDNPVSLPTVTHTSFYPR
ncbi:hypothetical protein L1887_29819 [Cichorium endivia]|nr:hypothetical protein L1887_29819 [Cichorium endivia]